MNFVYMCVQSSLGFEPTAALGVCARVGRFTGVLELGKQAM